MSALDRLVAIVRRRPWLAIGLAALVVASALWMARAPAVAVERVTRQDIVATVVASGRVRPFSRVRLGSAITGVVRFVPVREGDLVRAGDPLVLLDEGEAGGSVAQARARVEAATAQLDLASRVNLERAEARLREAAALLARAQADSSREEQLHAEGIVSDSQLDAARQALAVAVATIEGARLDAASLAEAGVERRLSQAALAEARGALIAAEARLLHTRIAAPGDGVVLTRDVEPGDAVQPGRILMEMAVKADIQLTAEPDEKNLALLARGQEATASAEAFPEGRFAARVIYVSPSVDRSRGTVEVRLAVDRPPDYLRPDMTVSVDIEVGRRTGALAIPASAVRDPTTETPWALVVRRGRIERSDLGLGARGEAWLEVRSGLLEGDLVVPRDEKGVVIGQRARPSLLATASSR